MHITLVYVIGLCAISYAFYEFWRDATVDQNALVLGSMCMAAAAALGIARDLWRRRRR
jgi:hypothetical protein